MKHMMLLLSAATLALTPLVSNAAKEFPVNGVYGTVTVNSCTCNSLGTVSGTDPVSGEDYEGAGYTCTAEWDDVIGKSDDPGPATYGASLDVKLLDETTGEEQILFAELEDEVCDGLTCTVTDAPIVLTNYTGEAVEVEAAVKAFNTGKDTESLPGAKRRNFEKGRLPCTIAEPVPVAL